MVAPITIDLPDDIRQHLARLGADPSALIREAALTELFRRDLITREQLDRAMNPGPAARKIEAALAAHHEADAESMAEARRHLESLRGVLKGIPLEEVLSWREIGRQ